MGILDDPGAFYAPLGDDWAQGDLALAPTAFLWAQGERQSFSYPQPAPLPNGEASVVYDLWEATPLAVATTVQCYLGPVMVVSDDCAIDKEFNAMVDQLLAQGMSENVAQDRARSDRSLDPLILIAPVLPYKSIRFVNEQAVRTAQAVGYFPVVSSPELDEGYVDLGRVQPVSRTLLSEPFAALSEPARSILRWKLAQYYAARNLSVDAEIAAAVGRTISAVHAVEDNKHRLIVDLELDNGAARLRLRQEPRREEAPIARIRGRSGQ